VSPGRPFADFMMCVGVVAATCILYSPHAAHMHPPQPVGQMAPPGPPGALQGSGQDPNDAIPVDRLNQMYMAAKDGRLDRLEADSRGYHSVYAA